MEVGIVEWPRHDRDWLRVQRKGDRLNLPVAEMASEVQHALAVPIGLRDVLLAFDVDARDDLLVGERAELDQLQQQTAEVHEHGTRDLLQLRLGP